MHSNGKKPEDIPQEEGIEAVGAFLRRWRDPVPDAAAKAQLIDVLLTAMEEDTGQMKRARHASPLQNSLDSGQAHRRAPLRHRRSLGWAWLLLRSQVRLVHPVTWVASALVIALGALVGLLMSNSESAAAPLVIVAPLVAACGVAFLYGMDADPMLELQLATPVSPRLILLARLCAVFGFNLVLMLVCSIVLALARADISLMPLITAWLAPMTFLSALAFLLSVIFFDALASALISLLLWIALALRHTVEITPLVLPDLLRVNYYPAMVLIAPVLVLAALWLADREERWTGGLH